MRKTSQTMNLQVSKSLSQRRLIEDLEDKNILYTRIKRLYYSKEATIRRVPHQNNAIRIVRTSGSSTENCFSSSTLKYMNYPKEAKKPKRH